MKLDYDTMCAIIECMLHDRDRFEQQGSLKDMVRIDSIIDDLRVACGYNPVDCEAAE